MSIDSAFITQRSTIKNLSGSSLAERYAAIAQASAQISELGKSIVLTGSRRSGKSTFIINQMADNYPESGRIGRVMLQYRSEYQRIPQLSNISFLMTDDERIPHESVVITAAAAKPTRALLDDDGVFFCRMFYDLIRFSFAAGFEPENTEYKVLRNGVLRSVVNYIDSSGGNTLSNWLSPSSEALITTLTDAFNEALKDRKFVNTIKCLFKYSENNRNTRMTQSEDSFALFSRRCIANNNIKRVLGVMWESLTNVLCEQLRSLCKSVVCDGCCFFEDRDTFQLVMVTAECDNNPRFFACHFVTQKIASNFYGISAKHNGNMRMPENYFSRFQYICRMSPEVISELAGQTDLEALEVARVNGKAIHALRFIEAGVNTTDGRVNDIDSIIKQYSCLGMIVFGADGELLKQYDYFTEACKVLRDGAYNLPTVIIRTKMEQLLIKAFLNKKSISLCDPNQSMEDFMFDVHFAEARNEPSLYFQIINELLKNRNKLRPKICGFFDSAEISPEMPAELLEDFERKGIKDSKSPAFIAEVISSILNNGGASKAIPVDAQAFSTDFAEFKSDSITITPNVFSMACNAWGESELLTADTEGSVMEKWLCTGEKLEKKINSGCDIPSIAFINSLRNVYCTYLKKHLVLSHKAVQSVTDCPDKLIKLLETNIQHEFGEAFSRNVGKYCYSKSYAGSEADAKQRYEAALDVLTGELFTADEVTITPDNTLGKLLAYTFNDCAHKILEKSCCVVYPD